MPGAGRLRPFLHGWTGRVREAPWRVVPDELFAPAVFSVQRQLRPGLPRPGLGALFLIDDRRLDPAMFADGAADPPRARGQNGAGELKTCGAGGTKDDQHDAPTLF